MPLAVSPIESIPDIPAYATAAVHALESAGHEAWFVGGCVRDALLGRSVNDYDIASSAHWEQAEGALATAGFAVHRTGTKHGTVTASLSGKAVEVTTYRADGAYSDGRHPDEVSFVRTIEEDLARRDFTVNALAYHPDRGLLDCFDGRRDLERGVIRAVGDPAQRFAEDALRILRACRFCSQLGFAVDEATYRGMLANKRRLWDISAERITHELTGLLLGAHVHGALMGTVDVLGAVLPEIVAMKGFEQHTPYHVYDVWEHTAWVVQRTPADAAVRWAALFHDMGKPASFFMEGDRGHFYGHPQLSAVMAKGAMERLALSAAFKEEVLTLVRMHDQVIEPTERNVRRCLARLGGRVGLFRALCALKRADALAQSSLNRPRLELAEELEAVLDRVVESQAAFGVGQLAVDGHDVMGAGVPEGPAVGSALAAALDAVIDGRIPNERGALLAFVGSLAQGN